jgi:hypothetical protein
MNMPGFTADLSLDAKRSLPGDNERYSMDTALRHSGNRAEVIPQARGVWVTECWEDEGAQMSRCQRVWYDSAY